MYAVMLLSCISIYVCGCDGGGGVGAVGQILLYNLILSELIDFLGLIVFVNSVSDFVLCFEIWKRLVRRKWTPCGHIWILISLCVRRNFDQKDYYFFLSLWNTKLNHCIIDLINHFITCFDKKKVLGKRALVSTPRLQPNQIDTPLVISSFAYTNIMPVHSKIINNIN